MDDIYFTILLNIDNKNEMNKLANTSKVFHTILQQKYFWENYFTLHPQLTKDADNVIDFLFYKANNLYDRSDIKFHFTTNEILDMNMVFNLGIDTTIAIDNIFINVIFWKNESTYDLYVNVNGKMSYSDINYEKMKLLIQYIYFHYPNKKLKYTSYKNNQI
jgi:hypothetical protein